MREALSLAGIETRGLPGRMAAAILAPQLLFYVGVQHGTLAAALAAAGGWTIALQLFDLARRRRADPFLLYGIVFTIVQAAVALYARNPAVFAGGGVIENLLLGLVLLGSVLLCRPLLSHVMGVLQGPTFAVPTLPVRAALGRLTGLWGLGLLARAAGLYAALTHLTLGQFLVVNALAGWPLTGLGMIASLLYLRAQLRRPRVRPVACGRRPAGGRSKTMMRNAAVALALLAMLVAQPATAIGSPRPAAPHVAILSAGMADARSLRIDVATSGLEAQGGGPPVVELAVMLDGVPARAALPLLHMPARFAMLLDLPAGVIRVGGVEIGRFHPVLPFTENMRFPVEVTVRRGGLTSTARGEATILLPTVIVPGYLNELGGPDRSVLAAFRRHGYAEEGPAPTLFWFTYPSRTITLEDGAQALAAYVRHVVLPATYAAKINVIGYSVGGLMARRNAVYDTDRWAALVNRLILLGVPNEGAVLAYLGGQAPPFLPFSGWGRSPLARAVVPAFPFWRAAPDRSWGAPPGGESAVLAELNARPTPPGVRVAVFYGSHDPRSSAGPQTAAGITGPVPGATLAYEAGDGVVLAASAQGLPIHGGDGVPALGTGSVIRVNLGSVYHTHLLAAGADRIAAILLDRFRSTVDEATAPRSWPERVGQLPGRDAFIVMH